MIKKKKMPITGTNTAMRPKSPVLTNANESSAQAMQQIKQPPQPFANKKGPVNVPVHSQFESRGTDFSGPGKSAKGTAMGGAKGLPSGKAVGYSKLPDSSKQVGGRFGTSHPKKKGSFFPASFKSKRNASFYGEN